MPGESLERGIRSCHLEPGNYRVVTIKVWVNTENPGCAYGLYNWAGYIFFDASAFGALCRIMYAPRIHM